MRIIRLTIDLLSQLVARYEFYKNKQDSNNGLRFEICFFDSLIALNEAAINNFHYTVVQDEN
jgi:hypothetical protein